MKIEIILGNAGYRNDLLLFLYCIFLCDAVVAMEVIASHW